MGTVLLLLDVQRNMLLPPEPVPEADRVGPLLADLLDRARAAGVPVVHIRNNGTDGDPDLPGSDGWRLAFDTRPGEPIVDKHEQDAFAGTTLADVVPADASLVVAGMQSEFCVRATSLAALRRGHRVTLVRGGHATYDGGRPARETSLRVEAELAAAGVGLADPDALGF